MELSLRAGENGVEADRKNVAITREVGVRREDLPAASGRDRAYQKIGPGPGNPTGAALVREPGRLFKVFHCERLVSEGAQVSSDALELSVLADAREQFLPDRPNQA